MFDVYAMCFLCAFAGAVMAQACLAMLFSACAALARECRKGER
jgi:hypothetical protein